MRRLIARRENDLTKHAAYTLKALAVYGDGRAGTVRAHRRHMCSATPQRFDNSLSDGNISFSFEGELELLELQRHSAGLFTHPKPATPPPPAKPVAATLGHLDASPPPHIPSTSDRTPPKEQQRKVSRPDIRIDSLTQSHARWVEKHPARREHSPAAGTTYVHMALDVANALYALPFVTTVQQLQQHLVGVHCDALVVMLEDAFVTKEGSLPVLRALLAALDTQKTHMNSKQAIYVATLLLSASLHHSLAPDAHRFILLSVYAHAHSAQGYVALRFLQILTRVPRPLPMKDDVSAALRSSILNSCLCQLMHDSGRAHATHLGGLHVTQVVQETVTLCQGEVNPLVLHATLDWLAARRRAEKGSHRKPLPPYLFALQGELESESGANRGGLRRLIRDTAHFAVPSCDRTLPLDKARARSVVLRPRDTRHLRTTLGADGVDSLASIHALLQQVPQRKGKAYLGAVARVHQFVLQCANLEEVNAVARAVTQHVPLLSSILFERFLAIVLAGGSLSSSSSSVVVASHPPLLELELMNILLRQCDALEAARALLWHLRRAWQAKPSEGLSSKSSFAGACQNSARAYTAVSLIPVVFEQYVLENSASLTGSSYEALQFLHSLTRLLPPAQFCAERTLKAVEAVVAMEAATAAATGLTTRGRQDTSSAAHQAALLQLREVVHFMRTKRAELQQTGEHITAVFGPHPSVFHWLAMEDVARQPSTRHALREYYQASRIMSDWKSECALSAVASRRQRRAKGAHLSVVGQQMVQFGELQADEDSLPSTAREKLATLRALAATLPTSMQRIEQEVNWRRLTRTWVGFFVSLLLRESSGRRRHAVSSASRVDDEKTLHALRAEMRRTLSVSTEAVDSLLHYLLIPSRIYVRPYRTLRARGASPSTSPEVRLHTAMVDSLCLTDRIAGAASPSEGQELQSFLAAVAFPLLYSYAHFLLAHGKAEAADVATAPALDSWVRWVRNALWISSLDLIQLHVQRDSSSSSSSSATEGLSVSVEDVAKSYLVVLRNCRKESEPLVDSVDMLLPMHHNLVLEKVLLNEHVSEDVVRLILAELERISRECTPLLPPFSTRVLEMLLMTYVTRGERVPSYLHQITST